MTRPNIEVVNYFKSKKIEISVLEFSIDESLFGNYVMVFSILGQTFKFLKDRGIVEIFKLDEKIGKFHFLVLIPQLPWAKRILGDRIERSCCQYVINIGLHENL